jgi:hypothetical protein
MKDERLTHEERMALEPYKDSLAVMRLLFCYDSAVSKADKPRIIRPPWEEWSAKMSGFDVICGCGQLLTTQEQNRSHWQSGHFDYQSTVIT